MRWWFSLGLLLTTCSTHSNHLDFSTYPFLACNGDIELLNVSVSDGGSNGVIRAVGKAPNGQLYIGGTFTHVNGEPKACIARLFGDGSLDTNFTAQFEFPLPCSQISRVLVQSDGRPVVIFDFYQGDYYLARFNLDGSNDSSFPYWLKLKLPPWGMPVLVHGPILDRRDGILFYGNFSTVQTEGEAQPIERNYLARLLPDGRIDHAFAPPISAWYETPEAGVREIAFQPDNKLICGGVMGTTNRYRYVFRLNADGSVDTSFAYSFDVTPQYVMSLRRTMDSMLAIATSRDVIWLNADGGLLAHWLMPTNWNIIHGLCASADGSAWISGWDTTLPFDPNNPKSLTGYLRVWMDGTTSTNFPGCIPGADSPCVFVSPTQIVCPGESNLVRIRIICEPRLQAERAGSNFVLSVSGALAYQRFRVEASSNLVDWSAIAQPFTMNHVAHVTNSLQRQQFFRASLAP